MKKNSFFDFIVIISIVVLLATVTTFTYIDFTSNNNKKEAIENHWVVIKFINKSLDECKTGKDLILKQNSKTNTENLCPSISSGNAIKMQNAFINHFNELEWCNTFVLKNTSENCKKVMVGETIHETGNLGETVISVSGTNLTIHTKTLYLELMTLNSSYYPPTSELLEEVE